MATREYGVDNGDGTITVWGTDDQGNFWPIRTEPVAQNQGGAPPASSGGATYQTRDGLMTLPQIMARLRSAGYSGPDLDPSTAVAKYNGAPSGGGAGAGAGTVGATGGGANPFPGTEFVNPDIWSQLAQIAAWAADAAYKKQRLEDIDKPTLQLQKDQAAWNAAVGAVNAVIQAAGLASNEALQVANIVAGLRGPSSAFKQMEVAYGLNQSGASRAFDALAGKYDVAGFQAPQASPEAVSLGTLARDTAAAGGGTGQLSPVEQAVKAALDLMKKYGPDATGSPFGGTTPGSTPGAAPGMTEDQALDYIWSKRPDLASFYKNAGWPVDAPDQQRAAVRNWLSMTDEPAIKAAGGDPLKVAQSLGANIGGSSGVGIGLDGLAKTRDQSITWYNSFTQIMGRAPSKDEWAAEISRETGMTYDNALRAYDFWRNWQQRTGRSNPTSEEWAFGLRQIQPGLGETPTFTAPSQGGPSETTPGTIPGAPKDTQMPVQVPSAGFTAPNFGDDAAPPSLAGMVWSPKLQQPTTPPQERPITDIDRAYNDAYSKAQAAANGGQSDMMFRYAPKDWQPGMPVQLGTNQTGFTAPAYTPGSLAEVIGKQGKLGVYANNPRALADLNALPGAPNKLVGRNFLDLDPYTQKYTIGAFETAGYDPEYTLDVVKKGLPQFRAPSFGRVA